MMAVLGVLSVQKNNQSAKYFLLAAISAIIGSSVTALAVWGFIPFNLLTFHAAEIGMVFDAILLAIALAKRIQLTEQEKFQALKMAGTDLLTTLNNRRAFYSLVEPIWDIGIRNHRAISLIIIDIDKFKMLNDTYGHEFGDKVLVILSKILNKEARNSDIIARWGGEEFVICLPETELADAINIAERIRHKVVNKEIIFTGLTTRTGIPR